MKYDQNNFVVEFFISYLNYSVHYCTFTKTVILEVFKIFKLK
jgi:hypothetical protein